MTSDAVRERIMRCLALSQSPNRHEAELAMKKARELMAKYRMEVSLDQMDPEQVRVETREIEDITFTKRHGFWISCLADIVSKRFCCMKALVHYGRGRTYHLQLYGRKCDVDVCEEVIRYAVAAVRNHIAAARYGPDAAYCYGTGFAWGIYDVYQEQDLENPEYGLVLTVPDIVKNAYANDVAGNSIGSPKLRWSDECYSEGRADGAAHMRRKIGSAENAGLLEEGADE